MLQPQTYNTVVPTQLCVPIFATQHCRFYGLFLLR
jgi:hypothetical protein